MLFFRWLRDQNRSIVFDDIVISQSRRYCSCKLVSIEHKLKTPAISNRLLKSFTKIF